MGGIDMKMDKKPGVAGFTTFKHCYEAGVNFKATGDCLIIAPMFICEKKHIDEIIEKDQQRQKALELDELEELDEYELWDLQADEILNGSGSEILC